MNISLKPEYEQFVQSQVDSGRFASIDEAIGYAFHLLENEQEYAPLWLESVEQEDLRQVDTNQKAIFLDRNNTIC